MQAGDADVVQAVDVVAHHLGGDGGFLGDGYVRSSCRGDKNDTLAARSLHATLDDPGLFVETRIRHDFRYLVERGGVRPRDEQA